ncbi:TonB-dependent outer membrane receptor [Tenacibaculum maritimum]|uniref:outer membrane beta-barrel family protein n=1 Tax=Tenacibaculum maritimum TaxID=107401 RepID=UPI0012E517BB|nr:outer membrane beta-barrel family protein [Tenacibaculum maritimum]CAA0239045.1 TonB-dependent outer membrane receptor [Tenacibaculum maritimum]
MKKLLLFIFCIYNISLYAQKPKMHTKQTSLLSGIVLEASTRQPLEYATIILTDLKNQQITGGITNEKGLFLIRVPQGSYDINIEFIGFKTKQLSNKILTNHTSLGTILLSEDTETLEEVEVIAEKSTIEIRLDKKIYNVGKDMTVKGGSVSDVLDNVPAVHVDAEGTVSLRGNENVRILIDGKPSSLIGLNSTDALRNLPAEAIEKVEVITSPSARYDAEGTAGILNIILKKGNIRGVNGAINLTTGIPEVLSISPNLNYRAQKINLFSNMNYSYRKSPGNSQTFFTNFNPDTTIKDFRNEDRFFDRKNTNINTSLGLEYYLTKNSSITSSFFYKKNNSHTTTTNFTENSNLSNSLTSTENRIENEDKKTTDKQYTLNYTNNFHGKGKKLVIEAQYNDSSSLENAPVSVAGILEEINSQITNSKDFLFQIDYLIPFGKNSQLEFGHKTTVQDLFSDFKVRDKNGTPFEYDPSNAIDFKQNIYAFYIQYGNRLRDFSYLLGLRTEITDIDLAVLTTKEASNKNYTEWFPTINLGYELNKYAQLTLGYSRRLRRPRHWFLNPFESRSSARNIFKGNPDINPTFTSSFDIGYTNKINKLIINTSIYYQHSTDIMQAISFTERRIQNGKSFDVFIRTPVNLGTENRYGFELTSNYSPSKKIRLSATFNYFHFNIDAFTYTYKNLQSVFLDKVNQNSWFARFNTRISLPAKIQWQTRLLYRGAQTTALTDRKGVFITNLAFSRDFFKDKASLILNINDLFNSRKRNSTTYYGGRITPVTISTAAFQWRERQISLSFTYRFNQKKKRPKQNHSRTSGSGDDFEG